MAITTTQVSVTAAGQTLFTSVTGFETVYVQEIRDGSGGVVRYGGTGLTAANGLSQKVLRFGFQPQAIGDVLKAITQAGTAKVNVLVMTQG